MSPPKLLGVPCWTLPVFAGVVWLATLLSMITSWVSRGSTHYPEMWAEQRLAYISNVGASGWGRPLFMGGSVTMVVSFSFALATERWLRHKGRLLHSSSRWMTFCSIMTAIFLVAGSCSLIFLTIFDVRDRPLVHYPLVSVFIFGYILAAVFMCAERYLLCYNYPTNKILRLSFNIKMIFIITELLFVILFGAFMFQGVFAPSVVFEWIIGFFFALYMWSCAIDFFAVPEATEKGDMMGWLYKDWDEEAGLAMPKKARYNTVHKHYVELP